MKLLEQALKRCMHPVVFATWTGFLIYLLVSQRFVDFLRPEFGLLLTVANLVAIGFMLAAMIRPKKTEMDTSAILRALVLLIPVLYYVAMPDTMLGNQAFKKRFIGANNGTAGRQTPTMLSSQGAENNPDAATPPGEIESIRQETPQERTILELIRSPNLFKEKRVIVTGIIMRDEELKPHFGGRDTVVYRFMINCCAADALPLAIVLDSDQTDAFAKDQWVQVDGIFDLQQINGKPVPMLLKPQIKLVAAPPMPYLFPPYLFPF